MCIFRFKYLKNNKSHLVVITLIFSSTFLIVNAKNISELQSINSNLSKCSLLFKLKPNSTVVDEATHWLSNETEESRESQIHEQINNCDNFLVDNRYFLNLSKTQEEENLRIAFGVVVFKSATQVERLLRTIYRPWNYYCIHIDKKSDQKFVETIEKLKNCLNGKYGNVILTKNRVDVQWGTMSVLQADLNCMKELYEKYKDWKYLINLTGQEFPLKTNAELAKILTIYKGANNLEGTYTRRNEDRVPTVKMPFPIVWYKGSVHITVNRDFIKFVFESPKSKIMLDTLKNVRVPDEQFFATLNHNPQLRIPGSFIGDPDEGTIPGKPIINFMTRYKNWGEYSCESKKVVRAICIWGVGDLSKIVRAPHLFTNKFYEDFQPAALHCMEKWYYDKVEKEVSTGRVRINETFYSSLPFVKYRYIPPID